MRTGAAIYGARFRRDSELLPFLPAGGRATGGGGGLPTPLSPMELVACGSAHQLEPLDVDLSNSC